MPKVPPPRALRFKLTPELVGLKRGEQAYQKFYQSIVERLSQLEDHVVSASSSIEKTTQENRVHLSQLEKTITDTIQAFNEMGVAATRASTSWGRFTVQNIELTGQYIQAIKDLNTILEELGKVKVGSTEKLKEDLDAVKALATDIIEKLPRVGLLADKADRALEELADIKKAPELGAFLEHLRNEIQTLAQTSVELEFRLPSEKVMAKSAQAIGDMADQVLRAGTRSEKLQIIFKGLEEASSGSATGFNRVKKSFAEARQEIEIFESNLARLQSALSKVSNIQVRTAEQASSLRDNLRQLSQTTRDLGPEFQGLSASFQNLADSLSRAPQIFKLTEGLERIGRSENIRSMKQMRVALRNFLSGFDFTGIEDLRESLEKMLHEVEIGGGHIKQFRARLIQVAETSRSRLNLNQVTDELRKLSSQVDASSFGVDKFSEDLRKLSKSKAMQSIPEFERAFRTLLSQVSDTRRKGLDKLAASLDRTANKMEENNREAGGLREQLTRLGTSSASLGKLFSDAMVKMSQLLIVVGVFSTIRRTVQDVINSVTGLTRVIGGLAQEFAKVRDTEVAFQRLAKDSELAARVLARLDDAAQGAVSTFDLLNQATRTAVAGLPLEGFDQLVRGGRVLAAVMGRDATESVERLTNAIAKQERRLLDELGIVVRANEIYRNYAERLGITTDELTANMKAEAFREEVLRKVNERVLELGDAIDRTQRPFNLLAAQAREFRVVFGGFLERALGVTATVDGLTSSLKRLTDLFRSSTDQAKEAVSSFMETKRSLDDLRQVIIPLISEAEDLSATLRSSGENTEEYRQKQERLNEITRILSRTFPQFADLLKQDVTEGLRRVREETERAIQVFSEISLIQMRRAFRADLESIDDLTNRQRDLNNELRDYQEVLDFITQQLQAVRNGTFDVDKATQEFQSRFQGAKLATFWELMGASPKDISALIMGARLFQVTAEAVTGTFQNRLPEVQQAVTRLKNALAAVNDELALSEGQLRLLIKEQLDLEPALENVIKQYEVGEVALMKVAEQLGIFPESAEQQRLFAKALDAVAASLKEVQVQASISGSQLKSFLEKATEGFDKASRAVSQFSLDPRADELQRLRQEADLLNGVYRDISIQLQKQYADASNVEDTITRINKLINLERQRLKLEIERRIKLGRGEDTALIEAQLRRVGQEIDDVTRAWDKQAEEIRSIVQERIIPILELREQKQAEIESKLQEQQRKRLQEQEREHEKLEQKAKREREKQIRERAKYWESLEGKAEQVRESRTRKFSDLMKKREAIRAELRDFIERANQQETLSELESFEKRVKSYLESNRAIILADKDLAQQREQLFVALDQRWSRLQQESIKNQLDKVKQFNENLESFEVATAMRRIERNRQTLDKLYQDTVDYLKKVQASQEDFDKADQLREEGRVLLQEQLQNQLASIREKYLAKLDSLEARSEKEQAKRRRKRLELEFDLLATNLKKTKVYLELQAKRYAEGSKERVALEKAASEVEETLSSLRVKREVAINVLLTEEELKLASKRLNIQKDYYSNLLNASESTLEALKSGLKGWLGFVKGKWKEQLKIRKQLLQIQEQAELNQLEQNKEAVEDYEQAKWAIQARYTAEREKLETEYWQSVSEMAFESLNTLNDLLIEFGAVSNQIHSEAQAILSDLMSVTQNAIAAFSTGGPLLGGVTIAFGLIRTGIRALRRAHDREISKIQKRLDDLKASYREVQSVASSVAQNVAESILDGFSPDPQEILRRWVRSTVISTLTEGISLAIGPALSRMKELIAAMTALPETVQAWREERDELRKLADANEASNEQLERLAELERLLALVAQPATALQSQFNAAFQTTTDQMNAALPQLEQIVDSFDDYVDVADRASRSTGGEVIPLGAPMIPRSTAQAEENARILAAPALMRSYQGRTQEIKIQEELKIQINDEATVTLGSLDDLDVDFWASRLAQVQERMKQRRAEALGRIKTGDWE